MDQKSMKYERKKKRITKHGRQSLHNAHRNRGQNDLIFIAPQLRDRIQIVFGTKTTHANDGLALRLTIMFACIYFSGD